MFNEESPRPKNEEELWGFVNPERFERYQKNGSLTMIDHYYDKLLQIADFKQNIV